MALQIAEISLIVNAKMRNFGEGKKERQGPCVRRAWNFGFESMNPSCFGRLEGVIESGLVPWDFGGRVYFNRKPQRWQRALQITPGVFASY